MSEIIKCPLETRKQLLIAESEINRTLLIKEYRVMADGVREAVDPVKKLGILAGSVAAMLGVFRGLAPGSTEPAKSKKSSLVGMLLRWVIEGWLGLRGPTR